MNTPLERREEKAEPARRTIEIRQPVKLKSYTIFMPARWTVKAVPHYRQRKEPADPP